MTFRFGPFQVLARIAVGSSTQTFVATQEQKNNKKRVVCLKTLLPELSAERQGRRTFGDEVKIASRLRHKACAGIEEWGEEEGICWVTMEYITGETWSQVIERAEPVVPTSVVAFVIAEVCDGLHYAHTLVGSAGPFNIVHRSICSKNIVISDEGYPVIMDFGMSKSRVVKDATETGVIKGNFRYMSPEQILGRDLDPRSDIYSLGEVLFESLAPDSMGAGLEAIATAKLDQHPRLKDISPGIDPDLDAICARALEVDPAQRFTDAKEMRQALLSYVGNLQRVPTRDAVKKMLMGTFGNRISRRADVLRRLSTREVSESIVCDVLGATQTSREDVFRMTTGYDEASFLSTIQPGRMAYQEPMKRKRAKPAEARLKLRSPERTPSGRHLKPVPPERKRVLMSRDECPGEDVREGRKRELAFDDTTEPEEVEEETQEHGVLEAPTEALLGGDRKLDLSFAIDNLEFEEETDERGVDPEPTSVFLRDDQKS